MSHHYCCAVRVCCPEPEQQAVLVKDLGEHLQADPDVAVVDATADLPAGALQSVVAYLLKNYDFVPRGVGQAIADGYRPFFKERLPKEAP